MDTIRATPRIETKIAIIEEVVRAITLAQRSQSAIALAKWEDNIWRGASDVVLEAFCGI
jgi:hypothetical protein